MTDLAIGLAAGTLMSLCVAAALVATNKLLGTLFDRAERRWLQQCLLDPDPGVRAMAKQELDRKEADRV